MQEQQNIEWKENWRDEYLKWICGFANAQGGKIYIGKNNKGEVVGIENAIRLIEDLPNKIVTNLGIICDINLLSENDRQFIEIIVESYPNPVNFKGQYHYRSGSTKQELKGAALDKFLLQRHGKTWDSVPVPKISVGDLDENAFNIFRKKAKNSGRVDNDGVKAIINNGVSDGVIDGISDGVKEEIVSIVDLIANNEGINTINIVAKTGNKSKPSIERYLKLARDLEIIEFKGAAKTGGYFLTEKIKRITLKKFVFRHFKKLLNADLVGTLNFQSNFDDLVTDERDKPEYSDSEVSLRMNTNSK